MLYHFLSFRDTIPVTININKIDHIGTWVMAFPRDGFYSQAAS